MSWQTKQNLGADLNIAPSLLKCCFGITPTDSTCKGPYEDDCNILVYEPMCKHPELINDEYCQVFYGIQTGNSTANPQYSPALYTAVANACDRYNWDSKICMNYISKYPQLPISEQRAASNYKSCIQSKNSIVTKNGTFAPETECFSFCSSPKGTNNNNRNLCAARLRADCNKYNIKTNLCSCFQTMDTIADIDSRYAKYKGSHIDPICIYDVCQNNGYYTDAMLKRAGATCPSCIQIVDIEQSQNPIISGQNQAQVNLNCGSGQNASLDLLKEHDKNYEALQESIKQSNQQSNTALQSLINIFVIVVIIIISIIVLGTIIIVIKKKSNNNS